MSVDERWQVFSIKRDDWIADEFRVLFLDREMFVKVLDSLRTCPTAAFVFFRLSEIQPEFRH